jgi:hypothetical protein
MVGLRSRSDAMLDEDKAHAEGSGDTTVLRLGSGMKGGMISSF